MTNFNANGYALALFELAQEAKALFAYKRDAQDLVNLFAAHPQYVSVLSQASMLQSEREALMRAAFKHLPSDLRNCLLLLAARKQLRYVSVILTKLIAHINAALGISEGVVYSPVKLTPRQLSGLTRRVAAQLHLSELVLVNKIDPALLLGFRVEVRGEVIEDSAPSRLAGLRQELLKKEGYVFKS